MVGLDPALAARLQELVFQPDLGGADLRRVAGLTAQVPPEMLGGNRFKKPDFKFSPGLVWE